MAEAIAPPRDAGLVPLNPAVNVKMPPVTGVTVTTPVTVTDAPAATPNVTAADMPPRAQQIIAGVASADPKQKLEAVKLMNQQDTETAEYHPNLQPQWGKMFISALQGNYSDAYKYYNGGAQREEEARDVNNNRYYKQFNELGATGVVKDTKGNVLNPNQMKELDAKGGIISDSDLKVLQTAPWVNGRTNSTLANNALITPLTRATNDAYNAATLAGSANKNADEQIEILQTNPGVQKILDHISTLPAERRQKILGLVNQYKTNSANTGTTTEKRGGATGGTQNTGTNTSNIGGSASGGVGGQTVDGAVAPGAQVGGKAGISASDTSMVQGGVSVGQGVGTSASNANTLQEQQNVRTLIERELQGVISNSKDFDSYLRIQALDAQNKAASSAVPTHVMPPGYTNVTESDLQLGGTKAVIANRVEQLKNNALMAAWSNELYKATREAAKTGALIDMDSVSNQFQQSDMFKAINNTYAHRMSLEMGQPSPLKSGDLVVDPKTHKIFKK